MSSFFRCARLAARRLISLRRAFRSSSVISSPFRGRPRLRGEFGLPLGLLVPGESEGEPTTGAPGAVPASSWGTSIGCAPSAVVTVGGGSTGRGISMPSASLVMIASATTYQVRRPTRVPGGAGPSTHGGVKVLGQSTHVEI